MNSPRFSVVIPTRDRPETLATALETCVSQDHPSFEVIVFDNCGGPETKRLVDSISTGNIQYFRSDTALAMIDSWETALSHATGEYVIVLGDDDGLIPGCLRTLDRLFERFPTRALRWSNAHYRWPDFPDSEKRDILIVPLGNTAYRVNAAVIIGALGMFRVGYEALPMLYNSAVHRDVISEIRKKAGRVFLANNPDISSGIAVGHTAKEYVSLDFPLTVAGASGNSNGAVGSSLYRSEKADISRILEFIESSESAGFSLDKDLPQIYLIPICVADSFLKVKEKLFPGDNSLDVDFSELFKLCARQLARYPEKDRTQVLAALPEKFNRRLGELIEQIPRASTPPSAETSNRDCGFVPMSRTLRIDLGKFEARNIADACSFCGNLLAIDSAGDKCSMSPQSLPFPARVRKAITCLVKGDPVQFWM